MEPCTQLANYIINQLLAPTRKLAPPTQYRTDLHKYEAITQLLHTELHNHNASGTFCGRMELIPSATAKSSDCTQAKQLQLSDSIDW